LCASRNFTNAAETRVAASGAVGQGRPHAHATRFQRLAARFPIALLERYGDEAPAVLRAWADEIEGLAGEGEEFSRLS
jgi:hypothetical protein